MKLPYRTCLLAALSLLNCVGAADPSATRDIVADISDTGEHEGGALELWASNDPTPSPQPRSGPMVWMGDPDEFSAVTVDGLLELGPSPSPDSG